MGSKDQLIRLKKTAVKSTAAAVGFVYSRSQHAEALCFLSFKSTVLTEAVIAAEEVVAADDFGVTTNEGRI